jgi:hypothetical protein
LKGWTTLRRSAQCLHTCWRVRHEWFWLVFLSGLTKSSLLKHCPRSIKVFSELNSASLNGFTYRKGCHNEEENTIVAWG